MIDVLPLLPIQEPLIFTVVADPEPDEIRPILHRDGAVVDPDTHRPKPPDLFESQ